MHALARWFTVVAVLEAVSWAALLVAMVLKWVVQVETPHEGGVPVVGPVHGALFTVYVLTTLVTAWRLRWSPLQALVGLAAAVPPFGTVVFERWAARKGLLAATRRPARRAPAGA